jgi:four helix bundle protein
VKDRQKISSNAHEAQEGQSKPDFIAKMSVSRKEAREANMWLRFAVATGMVQPSDVTWELQESIELLRMIRQSHSNRTVTPGPREL